MTEPSLPSPADSGTPRRVLQITLPQDVYVAFSEEASRRYQHAHAAKARLFLALWDHYRETRPVLRDAEA